jgi:hypothetical protein
MILFGSSLTAVDDVLQQMARAARHTCRFVLDDAATNFASGVLVGSDLVLTAAHAFFDAGGEPILARAQERVVVEVGGEAVRLHERWLITPEVDGRGYAVRDVDRLDYALVRLERAVADDWCTIPAAASIPVLVPGLMLHVVQCVDREAPRISSGSVTGVSDDRMRVRYTASALPAASGSPVFDDAFRLIALHIERGDGSVPSHNLGLPIRRVAMDLESRKGGLP